MGEERGLCFLFKFKFPSGLEKTKRAKGHQEMLVACRANKLSQPTGHPEKFCTFHIGLYYLTVTSKYVMQSLWYKSTIFQFCLLNCYSMLGSMHNHLHMRPTVCDLCLTPTNPVARPRVWETLRCNHTLSGLSYHTWYTTQD